MAQHADELRKLLCTSSCDSPCFRSFGEGEQSARNGHPWDLVSEEDAYRQGEEAHV